MIIGLIKLRISDFKTANCKNYVSRKYKRAPGEPMHRILFFIAPEMSLCIPISSHRNRYKNSTCVHILRGLMRRQVISACVKLLAALVVPITVGLFTVAWDCRMSTIAWSRKNSHILGTYKRAINCIDSP